MKCPTCGRQDRRSTQANARYWALLQMISAELRPLGEDGKHTNYSADTWHLFFKGSFLGCEDVRLPNGRVHARPRSTAGLDVAEFNDYMTQIEAWASDRGIFLPDLAAA